MHELTGREEGQEEQVPPSSHRFLLLSDDKRSTI